MNKLFHSFFTVIFSAIIIIMIQSCSTSRSAEGDPNNSGKLKQELVSDIKDFHGDVGIYIHNLKTGETVTINADTLFPTASMIKLSIMGTLFKEIEQGKYTFNQPLGFKKAFRYPYPDDFDILRYMQPGDTLRLAKLMKMMVTFSDNIAAIWCQHMAGSQNVNAFLKENGFKVLRLNSHIPGREKMYHQYGWGVTSPREMGELVTKIWNGQLVSRAASEEMMRLMTGSFWTGESISRIPPHVLVLSKDGSLNNSRSEVLVVNASNGPYVYCVMTKNNRDQSWTFNNEGFRLLRTISSTVWNYFEPGYKWTPPNKGSMYYTE